MKKYLVLVALWPSVLMGQQSYPVDISYCWNLPTAYTDGTLIEPGDLDSTRIVVNRHSGELVIDSQVAVGALLPGELQCHTFVGAISQPGTYTGMAYAMTVDGTSSDPSNTAEKKFTGKPLPPQSFGVI
jgi:hypothetical protein